MKRSDPRKMKQCIGTARRLAAALLSVLLCALLCTPAAQAAGGKTGTLSWSLSGGQLTISGSGAMPEYTDSNMPPWSAVSEDINRIVVSEGVTSIGSLAFYNCSVARSVSLPSTVTSIGDRAFKFCSSLSYLALPAGLLSIGEAAFEYCETLNGIILPDGLKSIDDYAFDRCTSLSFITIPASVSRMGYVLFHCCTSLAKVVILAPITTLPDCTFYGCTALSRVSMPETVTEIGDEAFHDCPNLSAVYYSGPASEAVSGALEAEPSVRDTSVIGEDEVVVDPGTGSIYVSTGDGGGLSVKSSEDATITSSESTTYAYTVNGEKASWEEVQEAGEEDVITAEGSTTTTIDAIIHNDEGWSDVSRAAKNAAEIKNNEETNVKVNIQLEDGSTVSSRDLLRTAGSDITLAVTTENGNTWEIDQSGQTKGGFKQPSYDLDFTVTKLTDEDKQRPAIESETTYTLSFQGTTDFDATVGVPLKVGEARKVATLYQKDGRDYESIQSVVVDDTGTAWFPLANVDSKTEYYVAVNAAGVDRSEAIIPATMAKEYNLESTLMGLDGKQYRITGRSSRWGITGTQFAIYAAIGIGLMVLIVTLIMVTRNRIMRSKAKYAAEAAAEDIDEEALRMEIMRELLGEKDDKDP